MRQSIRAVLGKHCNRRCGMIPMKRNIMKEYVQNIIHSLFPQQKEVRFFYISFAPSEFPSRKKVDWYFKHGRLLYLETILHTKTTFQNGTPLCYVWPETLLLWAFRIFLLSANVAKPALARLHPDGAIVLSENDPFLV